MARGHEKMTGVYVTVPLRNLKNLGLDPDINTAPWVFQGASPL